MITGCGGDLESFDDWSNDTYMQCLIDSDYYYLGATYWSSTEEGYTYYGQYHIQYSAARTRSGTMGPIPPNQLSQMYVRCLGN
jgi:hypothetical protein